MAAAILASDALPDALRGCHRGQGRGQPVLRRGGRAARCTRRARSASRTAASCSRRGSTTSSIPDTIQDVIMARIDRLDEAPKRTLQTASVIGRDFTRRLVERLSAVRGRSDALLRELRAVELIYEKSVFPEVAYRFKHALTQDVAYRSLLVQRRRELHGLIGAAIEELYADRLAGALRDPRPSFLPGRGLAARVRLPAQGGREGGGGVRAARCARALRPGAGASPIASGDALPAAARMAIHQAKSLPRVLRRRLQPGPAPRASGGSRSPSARAIGRPRRRRWRGRALPPCGRRTSTPPATMRAAPSRSAAPPTFPPRWAAATSRRRT